MKRFLVITGAAFLTAIYAVSRLISAQAPPVPMAAATRVAVVNIEALMQGYKRAQSYKTGLDKALQPLKTQAEDLRKRILDRKRQLKVGNFDAATRKQWEEASNSDMKKLADLERQADALNSRKIDQELVPIYKEILETMKAHARANSIQVVLSYAEDPKIDPFSAASIGRKVNGLATTGCVTPFYVDPAVDITTILIEVLNRRHEAAPQTPK